MITVSADTRAKLVRWVAALRSGEYKQGYLHLYDGEGYCCLGVLSLLALEDDIPVAVREAIEESLEEGARDIPINGVFNWLGYDLRGTPPTWETAETAMTHVLTDMNDDPRDFNEIAQHISEWFGLEGE